MENFTTDAIFDLSGKNALMHLYIIFRLKIYILALLSISPFLFQSWVSTSLKIV